MTARPMRKHWPLVLRAHVLRQRSLPRILSASAAETQRHLALIREPDLTFSEVWFHSNVPRALPRDSGESDHKPPDERTLKLGKTIRILHERLPTLLASPLPQDILSPQISLHLFPSTHPHLPTVSGKLAYNAALWTAPVAWGRVPVVGNVRLNVLSERLVRNGCWPPRSSSSANYRNEKLIVRWETSGKTKGLGMGALYKGIPGSGQVDKITEFLGGDRDRDHEEFTGLFIFEFDEEGRIVTHTIEHAQEGGNWDKFSKVISVTDWLLGKAWGKRSDEEAGPGLALGFCPIEPRKRDPSGSKGC